MCDKMVAEAKLNQGEYNNALTVADKLFDAKEYERARVSYQKAQSLRPGATKPTERLREIGKIIADNKVQNVLYDVAFESAMKWLELKDYEKALGDFEQASLIKPDEALPKRKIDELKKILAEIKAKHESYDKLIVQADNKFNAKKYKEARPVYIDALKIFPNEKYPQNRINDIDIILKELDNSSEQKKIYDGLIADADAFFNELKYENAKVKYIEASKLRLAEEYPKQRIVEIDKIISDRAALQKAYKEAIISADTYFDSTDYTNAIGQYNIALGHKPDEEYPKNKIAEIDNIIAEQVFQKAKDKNYAEAIKLADSSFELNDLAQARTHYQKASEIKAEEDYPKGKISEIDKILAERKSVNDSYDRAIADGNRLFEAEDYEKSKSSFEEALQIKAEENYPKEKIAEIESILIKLNIQQQAYEKLIAEADGYFTETKYSKSKQAYQEALNVKPNEAYPADRIKEIDNMLADEKAKQESYDAAIALGDSQFNGKEYSKAKDSYNTASGIKPDEKYPKDKLSEIVILLAGILAQDEAYAKAITDADEKFNANIFDESLKSYQQALKIKPAEAYPGERIGEINTILADIKAKEEAYVEAISMGDKSFKSKDYLQAKDFYLKATEFKPDQSYTKEKLREIEQILAAERSQQESYDNAIANADKLFVAKDYKKARPEYESALTFKPKETYPNEKIEEIDKIIADIKAKQEAYD
ncbi:MAG: hypothetical protein K8S00_10930, partial [Bacteroidales bacterium]|nr:hypothetical protein [Bacteroidales bacterium]